MAAYYDEFENKYYNPDDDAKKPGQNENWKMIQKGFSKISSTQLETSEGLTLGKDTEDEESLTAEELSGIKESKKIFTQYIGDFPVDTMSVDAKSTAILTITNVQQIKFRLTDIMVAMYQKGARSFIIVPGLISGPYSTFEKLSVEVAGFGISGGLIRTNVISNISLDDINNVNSISFKYTNADSSNSITTPATLHYLIIGIS